MKQSRFSRMSVFTSADACTSIGVDERFSETLRGAPLPAAQGVGVPGYVTPAPFTQHEFRMHLNEPGATLRRYSVFNTTAGSTPAARRAGM
jgi:hypothetical protein